MFKRVFSSVTVIFICVLGIIETTYTAYARELQKDVEAQASILMGAKSNLHQAPLKEQVELLYRLSEKFVRIANIIPNAHYLFARASIAGLTTKQNPQKQTELICQALIHFRRATQLSPNSPRYHIAWADTKARIPSPSLICKDFPTFEIGKNPLTARERVQLATRLAPFSTTDIYLAAIVHLSIGDKQKGLDLLRLNQEINPLLTKAQRDYTYQLVTTEQDLKSALPHTFPEVVRWVAHFERLRGADYSAWLSTFEDVIDDATTELISRFSRKKLEPHYFSSYIKQISSLPLAKSSEKLRKRFDVILSDIYTTEGNNKWANLLEVRQPLSRIPLLKSVISNDKLPKSTMLSSWLSDTDTRIAELDVHARTIGMFVPSGHILDELLIENAALGSHLKPSMLEILVSNDNLRFHRYTDDVNIETFVVDGKQKIGIHFNETNFRYLKLHYTASNRDSKFSNSLQSLVQAYGRIL